MADSRINSANRTPSQPLPKAAAKKAEGQTPTPQVATDSFRAQGPDQTETALAIAKEALDFPPRPKKPAEQKAWLLDAYSRLLKADAAKDVLSKAWGEGKLEPGAYSTLRRQLMDAQRMVERADRNGAVKQEFFQGVLPPAKALIDGLADYPAPPADRAGKEAWLAQGRERLAKAEAAEELFKDAWFSFGAATFDEQADVGGQLFEFRHRLRQVEYELNPPAPRPARPGGSNGSAPIFGLTQGASNLANSKNPVSQVTGAVLMPIAVTVDVIDLVTRPFQWLSSISGKK